MTNLISPVLDDSFIPLANTRQGRIFRKHILNKGELIHPKSKTVVNIDDAFVQRLQDNFDAGVCDIVQVPLAGAANEHTEDPSRNVGRVIGIETEGDKVYANMVIPDDQTAEQFGKTLLGASAMMNQDYTDTRTGKKVGPTLLHVAVTNRPYVVGLDEYEEIIAASSDSSGEELMLLTSTQPVTPPEENEPMTYDDLVEELRLSHGVDIEELTDRAELVSKLAGALQSSGMIALSNDDDTDETEIVLSAISSLVDDNVRLNRAAAEAEVDALVKDGKILPAKRDAMLNLRLSNESLFEELVPDAAIVALSHEEGFTPASTSHEFDVDAEIERISKAHIHAVK